MSKLIVIDGLDGSGKATQVQQLAHILQEKHYRVRQITFPDYEHGSSALVKMYLNGEIAKTPEQVNAYAAASFYACDRYISFHTGWKSDYHSDAIILADRYVSSNAIHQMVKLPMDEWDEFLKWLYHYEYTCLGVPREDNVIYLDVDPKISQRLITQRYHGNENKRDIHEQNVHYLIQCRQAAMYAAQKLRWRVLHCDDGEKLFSIDYITSKLQKMLGEILHDDQIIA